MSRTDTWDQEPVIDILLRNELLPTMIEPRHIAAAGFAVFSS